jgi:hypothetical protein
MSVTSCRPNLDAQLLGNQRCFTSVFGGCGTTMRHAGSQPVAAVLAAE